MNHPSFSPKKFREIVIQILYSMDLSEYSSSSEELRNLLMHELKITEKQVTEACEKAALVTRHVKELDQKIEALSLSYNVERIGKVEKNILRLSFWELIENLLPREVIIAEAIRLTRKFSSDSSVSFVTAVLNGEDHASVPPS